MFFNGAVNAAVTDGAAPSVKKKEGSFLLEMILVYGPWIIGGIVVEIFRV